MSPSGQRQKRQDGGQTKLNCINIIVHASINIITNPIHSITAHRTKHNSQGRVAPVFTDGEVGSMVNMTIPLPIYISAWN